MNIVSTLNNKLLKQSFTDSQEKSLLLKEYQDIARMYSILENSLAVLSDFKSNKSYIYNGGVSEELGIAARNSRKEINSIWEKEIFNRIHPDDLIDKHLLELRFFHLLKTLPIEERSDYHIISNMRMLNEAGKYVTICHRMFYASNCPFGSLWLALCLYNYSYERPVGESLGGIIINSKTGDIVKIDKQECKNILSVREKEILRLIERGKMSKEIADTLSISKNTVDRHRQNILEKLRVKNSLEACRVAKLMKLL